MYLCGFLLLLASWVQPLHLLPWVSWHSEILAFLAGLCFAWQMVFWLATKGRDASLPLPVEARVLLWAVVLFGTQWAGGLIPFHGDVFTYGAYILLCITCLSFGYYSSRAQPEMLIGMATIVLLGALVSAVIALMQALEQSGGNVWIHSMSGTRRPGANLGQPNQLATLLLMGLSSLVLLLESNRVGVLPAALSALLLTCSLAATESRAGLLGYLVLNLWWFTKKKSIAHLISPRAAMLLGVLYGSIYWYWPVWMAEFYQLPGGVLPPNSVAYNRWIIWPQLVEAVQLHPWFGWGVGQVSAAHNAVADRYSISEPYTYAHNIVLDLALGIGLPLTLILLIVTGGWLLKRLRATRDIVSWYCIALVLPVTIHSMVEFPYAYAYFLAPVMLAIGFLEGHSGNPPALELRSKWVVGPLALATAMLVVTSVEYLSIEEDFRIVRFEAQHVGETPLDYEKPQIYLFDQLDALLYGGRVLPKPGMSIEQIELTRKVALRYPWPAIQNRYALTLALNGNTMEAIRQLKAMRAQHGAKTYRNIKAGWLMLAKNQYPQLDEIDLP